MRVTTTHGLTILPVEHTVQSEDIGQGILAKRIGVRPPRPPVDALAGINAPVRTARDGLVMWLLLQPGKVGDLDNVQATRRARQTRQGGRAGPGLVIRGHLQAAANADALAPPIRPPALVLGSVLHFLLTRLDHPSYYDYHDHHKYKATKTTSNATTTPVVLPRLPALLLLLLLELLLLLTHTTSTTAVTTAATNPTTISVMLHYC